MFKGNLHEFNGNMLSVKVIAGKVDLAPSTLYKYLNRGLSIYEAIEEGKKQSQKVFGKRKKTNNTKAKKYEWKSKMMTIPEIATLEGISAEPIYRRMKKGMSLQLAVSEIKNNIATKYPFLGSQLSKYQIEKLTGLPKSYLDKKLLDNTQYTEQEVIDILDSYQRPEVLMYGEETLFVYCIKNNYNYFDIYNLIKNEKITVEEAVAIYTDPSYSKRKKSETIMYKGMTLRTYCINNKYNYNSIYYSIKVLGYSVEEAVDKYLLYGQTSNISYRYMTGNILFYHFLIKMKIDDRYVFMRMSEGRSEEEAIIDAIFLSKQDYKNRKERNKLRTIYGELSDISELEFIKDKFSLSDEDIQFILDKHKMIENILFQLRLYIEISRLRVDISIVDFAKKFIKSGISLTELLDVVENLFDEFDEIEKPSSEAELKYIWHKTM